MKYTLLPLNDEGKRDLEEKVWGNVQPDDFDYWPRSWKKYWREQQEKKTKVFLMNVATIVNNYVYLIKNSDLSPAQKIIELDRILHPTM